MQHNKPIELSNKDADKCGILGFVGAAMATVTLLQHLYFMTTIFVAYLMVLIYAAVVVTFVLLMCKKSIAPLLLIVMSVLLFLIIVYFALATAFSLLVTGLMLFTITATITLYIQEIPERLKNHYLYKKQEADFWNDKQLR